METFNIVMCIIVLAALGIFIWWISDILQLSVNIQKQTHEEFKYINGALTQIPKFSTSSYPFGDGITINSTAIEIDKEVKKSPGCQGKPIKCINTGETFISQRTAAIHYGIREMVLSLHLHGHCEHAGKDSNGQELRWERVVK